MIYNFKNVFDAVDELVKNGRPITAVRLCEELAHSTTGEKRKQTYGKAAEIYENNLHMYGDAARCYNLADIPEKAEQMSKASFIHEQSK
ncbi:MAG: hypothetical protein V1870_00240 [Candidatus Aenigmatarchaeota archaeon]